MNRLILISIILLTSNIAFGQEHKISIGFLTSMDKFELKPIAGFNTNHELNPAYSFGLNLKYNFSERLFTKGIIQYSKRGYELNYEFNFTDPGDPYIPRETTFELNYIGIPLFIGYNLYHGEKFKIAPSLGLVNELLVNDYETSVFEDDSERESKMLSQNLDKFLISSQLNLSLDYYLSDMIFLSLEPYLRIGFTEIENDFVKSNPISYGGILSINYNLK